MPTPPKQVATGTSLFIGIDVGGTNIKLGIVDNDGKSIVKGSFSTDPRREAKYAFIRCKEKLDGMLEEQGLDWNQIAAVGLGTPGPLDLTRGLILTPTNLPGWHQTPAAEQLTDLLQKPVVLANDAGAAAFGEFWVGVGEQYSSLVLLTLGTGVGGGIIVDGMSIDGSNSHGAELGHLTIDTSESALPCGCGQVGHLEAYASASGLVERTRRLLASSESDSFQSSLMKRVTENSPLSALMIAEEAERGDRLANRMVLETARYLARGIADLAHAIDPSVFVLGGGMDFGGNESPLGRQFLSETISTAKKLVFPVLAEKMNIQFASLGGAAGYIGAAGLARQHFEKIRLSEATQ